MLRNSLNEKEQKISGKRTISKPTITDFTVIIHQYWFWAPAENLSFMQEWNLFSSGAQEAN